MQFTGFERPLRANVTPADYEQVKNFADARNISISQLLRIAIADYMQRDNKTAA